MSVPSPRDLRGLPERSEDKTGVVYALAYDTGIVKVGSTARPRGRVVQHQYQGRAYGATLVEVWVSTAFRLYRPAEKALVSEASRLAADSSRGEYLVGVGLADVVRLAGALEIRGEFRTVDGRLERVASVPRQRRPGAAQPLGARLRPDALLTVLEGRLLWIAQSHARYDLARVAYNRALAGERFFSGGFAIAVADAYRCDFDELFFLAEADFVPDDGGRPVREYANGAVPLFEVVA